MLTRSLDPPAAAATAGSAVYLFAAYRWDSRTVLALALTTLAAWRGISYGLAHGSIWRADWADLRLNAVALGAVFLAAAACSVALARKPHFEAVFANTGVLLLLGALVSGALGDRAAWGLWLVALLVAAGLVMWLSFRLRRSLYFAQGVVAAYLGLLRLVLATFHFDLSSVSLFIAALLGVGAIAVISAAHRRMGER